MKSLTKIEVFGIIEDRVSSLIEKYFETRSVAHLRQDDLKVLRQVWAHVAPTSYFNASCPSCIKAILDIIDSWYSRESKRWEAAHPGEKKGVAVIPLVEEKKKEEGEMKKEKEDGSESPDSPILVVEKKKRGRKPKNKK